MAQFFLAMPMQPRMTARDMRAATEEPQRNGSSRRSWQAAQRLLVVRTDNIGDVIMAGPALRAVKETSEARLTLLASPGGAEAAQLLPWVDDIVVQRVLWQDLGRLPFSPDREHAHVEQLRRGRFDGAIILTSFSQSPHPAAFAAWLAGIPLRAGASKERSEWLTDALPFGPFERHQAERNLAVVEALGFHAADRTLAIRVSEADHAGAAALLAERGLQPGADFILLNPWASAAARDYRADRVSDAASCIVHATRLPIVVTGHARDAARTAKLVASIGPTAIDLCGATTLGELAALVAAARLVITSNTSVMHMADALHAPSVVLFSGTELESQWAPRDAPHLLLRNPTYCSPCYALSCPYDQECLDIEPERVADAALRLLADTAAQREAAYRKSPS